MRGDQADMVSRLRLTLPDHWFADEPVILSAVLNGISVVWSGLYDLLQFVQQQSRIGTATDGFLDLVSRDFFGFRLPRRATERDEDYRTRVQRALRRERGTRVGLKQAAAEAGFTATIFEPAQPGDTGAYSTPGRLAWNTVGGWGSLQMPFECFVVATPGQGADHGSLRQALTDALPAGGAAWLRISS